MSDNFQPISTRVALELEPGSESTPYLLQVNHAYWPWSKSVLPGSLREIARSIAGTEAQNILLRLREKGRKTTGRLVDWALGKAYRSVYQALLPRYLELISYVPREELDAWKALYAEFGTASKYQHALVDDFSLLKPWLSEFARSRPARRMYLYQLLARRNAFPYHSRGVDFGGPSEFRQPLRHWTEALQKDERLIKSVMSVPKIRTAVFNQVVTNALAIVCSGASFPGVLPGTKAHWTVASIAQDVGPGCHLFRLVCAADEQEAKAFAALIAETLSRGVYPASALAEARPDLCQSLADLAKTWGAGYLRYQSHPLRSRKWERFSIAGRSLSTSMLRGLDWLAEVPDFWLLTPESVCDFEVFVYRCCEVASRGILFDDAIDALYHPGSEGALIGYVGAGGPAIALVYKDARRPERGLSVCVLTGESDTHQDIARRIEDALARFEPALERAALAQGLGQRR